MENATITVEAKGVWVIDSDDMSELWKYGIHSPDQVIPTLQQLKSDKLKFAREVIELKKQIESHGMSMQALKEKYEAVIEYGVDNGLSVIAYEKKMKDLKESVDALELKQNEIRGWLLWQKEHFDQVFEGILPDDNE